MSLQKENRIKRKSKHIPIDSVKNQQQEENEGRRLSSRVKKPKLVYDPSDKDTPYKEINIDELTKSPMKAKVSDSKSSAVVVATNSNEIQRPKQRNIQFDSPKPVEEKSSKSSRATSRNASGDSNNVQQSDEDNDFSGFDNDTVVKKDEAKTADTKTDTTKKYLENPQINEEKAKQLFDAHSDSSDIIPDVSPWTYQQTYDYFVKYFPQEAYVFKDQEIDGTSLLLMTRSDVLKLNMKLGPALNIYRHIVMLQTRSYDPRKTWM